MQRSHAIANGVFVVAVNRVGHEGAADGGIQFWESSNSVDVKDPVSLVQGDYFIEYVRSQLAEGRRLSRLQNMFIEKGAVQCGFCIPGQLMAADDLLRRAQALGALATRPVATPRSHNGRSQRSDR